MGARDDSEASAGAAPPPIGPIFLPQVEAKVTQALNILMLTRQGSSAKAKPAEIEEIAGHVSSMVDRLFPEIDGHADVVPHSLSGHQYVHPIKVAQLALLLGRLAGGERTELRDLGMAAVLMNVGYVALRASLLDHQQPLDADDLAEVRRHPERSGAILAGSGISADALAAVAQHHERWDGSGYHVGLRGEEIHVYARIIAVADVFVALRSQRPQRRGLTQREALLLMREGAGTMFDPEMIDVLETQAVPYLAETNISPFRKTA
jgi:HD-GYP domain-containing protein (c-di-GMP phosphodiesterase class II)